MVLEQIDGFFKYINERHQIYCRRQAGIQAPWTEDPIIKEFSFCNVFRELDSVTIWLRKNWKEPYADHPNLPFAMSVARQINWPDTLTVSKLLCKVEWIKEKKFTQVLTC